MDGFALDRNLGHIDLEGQRLPSGLILPKFPTLDDFYSGLIEGIKDRIRAMAGYSNAAEDIILDSSYGDGATNLWTAPTHLALTTSAVAETDTGSTLVEPTYTGYARKTLAAADMSASSGGSKTNSAQQVFAACTAGSSTVIGWATTNNLTTGAVIFFGTATSTVISTTQTPPQIGVGGLISTLD